MDVVYDTRSGSTKGILDTCTLDLAYGMSENDFQLSVPVAEHVCAAEYLIYVPGTEYGGIIDSISVDSESGMVTYHGRTWHGILEGKVICPDAGYDYLTLSGDANTVLSSLVTRLGLGDLFAVSASSAGVTISSYQVPRYVAAYTAIQKMLQAYGLRLAAAYADGVVTLSAKAVTNYSTDEEWDSSQMHVVAKSVHRSVNHLICLGTGELRDRTVIHLYVNGNGSISSSQTYTGSDEITETYDYPNCESADDLLQKGTEHLQGLISRTSVESIKLDTDDGSYEIGDIVGVRENITGINVIRKIIKKVVKIAPDGVSITYETGE